MLVKKISLLFVYLFFSFIFLLAQSSEPEVFFITTESGNLNLREKPVNGKVIGSLPKGSKVQAITDAASAEEIPIDWIQIIIDKKQKGYVAREFLTKFPAEKLDKLKLIGSVSHSPDTGGTVHAIAYQIDGKWIGTSTQEPDVEYFFKNSIKNKNAFNFLDNSGKRSGTFLPEKIIKTGCQEIKVVQGKLKSTIKLNDDTPAQGFAISNFGNPLKSSSLTKGFTKKIGDSISSEAKKIFQKNKVANALISKMEMDQSYTFSNPYKSTKFAFVRYAIKKDNMEIHNVYILAQVKNDALGKIISSKFQSIEGDMLGYGGEFYLTGVLLLEENQILIFHHNGFDGYINGVYQLDENGMTELALGGGDAC